MATLYYIELLTLHVVKSTFQFKLLTTEIESESGSGIGI